MASNFPKSLFISGLVALPVPLVLPYVLDQAGAGQGFSQVLSQDSATAYYVATWLLVTIAALISTLLASSPAAPAAKKEGASQSSQSSSSESGPEGNEQGSVKWFNVNKGFGFITTEAGEDIFVHFRSIRGRGRRSLRQGQKVRFDISNGEKGLQADNVSVIGE